MDVFPVNDGLQTSQGFTMQKRDRLSYAILHQVAAEYKGEFADNKLVLNAGVRVPFFRRNLTNNCFTSSAGGNLECLGSDAAQITAYAAAHQPRQRRDEPGTEQHTHGDSHLSTANLLVRCTY